MRLMKKINFHFIHGWGFDSNFWNKLKFELKKSFLDSNFLTYNLGFFGNEKIPKNLNNSYLNIFIVHSFGFNWLIKKKIETDCIFNFFGTPIFIEKKTSFHNRFIDKMIISFKKRPIPVIKAFYRKCGLNCKYKIDYNDLNSFRLNESLIELKNDNLLKHLEKKEGKIFSFFSDSDKILPFRNFKKLFNSTEHIITVFEKEEHAFPILKSFEASTIIKDMINKNFFYEK